MPDVQQKPTDGNKPVTPFELVESLAQLGSVDIWRGLSGGDCSSDGYHHRICSNTTCVFLRLVVLGLILGDTQAGTLGRHFGGADLAWCDMEQAAATGCPHGNVPQPSRLLAPSAQKGE